MIAQFENNKYELKDSVKCFYSVNDNLFLKGNFFKGKLHGEFRTYYKDKTLKRIFEYNNGQRNGSWKKFNTNGEIIKKVFYKNGNEFLIDFYDDQRNLIVKNGSGIFEDNLKMTSSNYKTKVKGNVINGLPDSEWTYYVSGNIISKEYFKNFIFEKGISFSKVLGQTEYHDLFNATFTDMLLIENLKLKNGYECKKSNRIGLGLNFFNKFDKEFYKQVTDKNLEDGWFLIDLKTGKNRKINDVQILSNSKKENIELIKNIIFKLKNPLSGSFMQYKYNYKTNFDFLTIVIKNSKPYHKFNNGDIGLLEL